MSRAACLYDSLRAIDRQWGLSLWLIETSARCFDVENHKRDKEHKHYTDDNKAYGVRLARLLLVVRLVAIEAIDVLLPASPAFTARTPL